jgi:hypothetical protein
VGCQYANGVGDGVPEATSGSFGEAGAASGVGDVLAGEAGGEDVHRLDGLPVDLGEVAEVGFLREVVGEEEAGGGVVVRAPGEFGG